MSNFHEWHPWNVIQLNQHAASFAFILTVKHAEKTGVSYWAFFHAGLCCFHLLRAHTVREHWSYLVTDRTGFTRQKKSFKVNIWHTVHVGRCATSIRGHFGCFLEQKHARVCFNTLKLYMYTAARHLRTKFHSIKPPLIAKALKNKYFLSYKYQRGAKICHNKMLFKYWELKRNTF